MKFNLQILIERGLISGDTLPGDLRSVWTSHVEIMQEIGKMKFKRIVDQVTQSIWI